MDGEINLTFFLKKPKYDDDDVYTYDMMHVEWY